MLLNSVARAALEIQKALEEQNAQFCFIGGIAVQRWGEPRFTNDADVTLLTRFVDDEKWTDFLLSRFKPRYPNAKHFALEKRVVLLHASNGTGLDVALAALDFEVNCVTRSSLWRSKKNIALRTCSAEDLIVHKAFASRQRDWLDVETILMRQGRKLDVGLIFRELEPLVALKEEPAILERLRGLMRKRKVL
jgi:hypothetical protein